MVRATHIAFSPVGTQQECSFLAPPGLPHDEIYLSRSGTRHPEGPTSRSELLTEVDSLPEVQCLREADYPPETNVPPRSGTGSRRDNGTSATERTSNAIQVDGTLPA